MELEGSREGEVRGHDQVTEGEVGKRHDNLLKRRRKKEEEEEDWSQWLFFKNTNCELNTFPSPPPPPNMGIIPPFPP